MVYCIGESDCGFLVGDAVRVGGCAIGLERAVVRLRVVRKIVLPLRLGSCTSEEVCKEWRWWWWGARRLVAQVAPAPCDTLAAVCPEFGLAMCAWQKAAYERKCRLTIRIWSIKFAKAETF